MSWDMSSSDRADEMYARAKEAREIQESLKGIGEDVKSFTLEITSKIHDLSATLGANQKAYLTAMAQKFAQDVEREYNGK
jgi:hypothetical protein